MWGKPKHFGDTSGLRNRNRLKSIIQARKCLLGSCLTIVILWIFLSSKKESQIIDINNLPPITFHRPLIVGDVPSDFYSQWFCDVSCLVGEPCEYKDEVDFRIIVMTFDRAGSLEKCLRAISNMDTLGDKVSVEIWIDRSTNGTIDKDTEKTAELFVNEWSKRDRKGRACIHREARNAYIGGQWIDTWRPKENTQELGLILEDDVSISQHAYRWIKASHAKYGARSDIAGYTLQMESTNFFAPAGNFRPMDVDKDQIAFLYPVIGTWGYAPHPKAWRRFQEWYHTMRPNIDIKTDLISPRVPGMEADQWFGHFLRKGRQETMWEMWHIRFTHDAKLFTLYSNMKRHLDREDIVLSSNRQEKGLHYSGNAEDKTGNLLKVWDPKFVEFPSDVLELNYDGNLCTEICCFETKCNRGFWKSLFNKG